MKIQVKYRFTTARPRSFPDKYVSTVFSGNKVFCSKLAAEKSFLKYVKLNKALCTKVKEFTYEISYTDRPLVKVYTMEETDE